MPRNEKYEALLDQRLSSLEYLPERISSNNPRLAEISGKSFKFEENESKLTGTSFNFEDKGCVIRIMLLQEKRNMFVVVIPNGFREKLH